MMALLPPGVLLPFALALLPAALPIGVSARRLALCAVACGVLTLALAIGCAVPAGAAWLCGATGAWRDDALARTLATLPALAWALSTLRASQPGEAVRPSSGRLRRWPVTGQIATAASMGLCRVELLALVPLLFGVLLLATRRAGATGRERALVLAALPVMAIGVGVLSAVIGAPARWSLLQPAALSGRAQQAGLVLLLAPALILSVAATLQPALSGRQSVLRGVSRMLMTVAALVLVLRCGRAAHLAPLLWLFGSGAIALSLLLLPACRGLPARLGLAVSLQNGVALLAVAIGGSGGIAVAVMIQGFLCLLLPLALWFPVDRGSARVRVLAIGVMLGLPPFGPFAAGLVLLVRLSGAMPLVAVLLLLAAALSAMSVLDAVGREPWPSGGARFTAWAGCACIVLLGVLWLGLAMPAALSGRLLLIGEAGP